MEPEKDTIECLVGEQRAFFQSQATRNVQFRLAGLRALKQAIKRYEPAINDALWQDLHKSPQEAFLTEISVVLAEIDSLVRHLKHWNTTEKVPTPLFLFGSRSRIRHEPYGVVAILAPWNYPFQLLVSPLAGALAAGNCAVLKPSPRTPAVNEVIGRMIAEIYHPQQVAFLEGGAEVARKLLEHRLDYIFFTGGTALGREVMAAAARNLTPVTLELGGKSPCVVDASADLEIAARRIVWGKFLNAGQTCVAPDYLYVHRRIAAELIVRIRKAIVLLYGDDPRQSPYYGRMVGEREVERMRALMGSGTIVCGGESDVVERYVAPTVLCDVVPDSPVLQEEIFGPILPVLEFDDLYSEVVPYICQREKPLALYYFGDRQTGEAFFDRVDSGGGCINDVVLHLANPALPFGGVGQSGMGHYHGYYSFQTFSRSRSVLISSVRMDAAVKYPPYAGLSWVRRLF